MAPYCGRIATVRRVVTKIIEEPTGKMIYMKQPCIMLEGVVCNGENAGCRLNCPRAIPSYWRELWLERVDEPAAAGANDAADISQGAACKEFEQADALARCAPVPSAEGVAVG
jgi:hypothetical protein